MSNVLYGSKQRITILNLLLYNKKLFKKKYDNEILFLTKKADHKYFLQSTLSFFNTIKNSIHNK